MTTIHANDPEGAIEQLALIVQASSRLGRADIVHYIRHVLEIVVQLERRDGVSKVTPLWDLRADQRSGTDAPA